MKKILLSVGVISLISSAMVYGATATNNEKLSRTLEEFKLAPQMTVWGLTGTNTSEEAQVMLPLWGDAKKLLYTVADGLMVDNQSRWTGSFGAGYRQLFDGDHILGAYILGEYTNTDSNRGFWAINPGVERLGELWDFRANGHLVFGAKQWFASEGWESDRRVDSYVYQTGHDFYDHQYKEYSSTGIGEDFEIGRKFPALKNLKLFVGAYHYDIANSSAINGMSARAEFPINNNFALDLRTTYDNFKHGVILGGIKVSLGGFSTEQKARFGMSGRLMDPIVHNIATNYAGVPVKNTYIDQGARLLKYDHVWYFKSDTNEPTGSGDGTYEHPFNTPNNMDGSGHITDTVTIQDKIDNVIANDPNGGNYARLFFAGWGGTYDLLTLTPENSQIYLPGNYDIMGRTDDYKLSAVGDQRPIFYNGQIVLFDGNNFLDSFKLYNDSNSAIDTGISFWTGGIGLKDDQPGANVTVENVIIGDQSTQNKYGTGISLGGDASITIDNSEVYAYCGSSGGCDENGNAQAIYAAFSSQVTLLNNNVLSAVSNSYTVAWWASNVEESVADGVYLDNSQLNINGNNNRIVGTANGSFANTAGIDTVNAYGNGIETDYGSSVIISGNNNQITGTANVSAVSDVGDSISAYGRGINADNTGNSINISGNNNTITGSASVNGPHLASIYSYGYGINVDGNDSVGISGNGNVISGNANTIWDDSDDQDSVGAGIRVGDSSNLIITGSNNMLSGVGSQVTTRHTIIGEGYGVYADNSTVNISGLGNTITADGVYSATGIYAINGDVLNVSGVTFNIGQQGTSWFSYGIELDTGFNLINLTATNNIFNISGNTSSSNRYGILSKVGAFSSDQYNSLVNNNTFNGVSGNNQVSPQPLLAAPSEASVSSAAVASAAPQQPPLASESSNVDGNNSQQLVASKVIIKLKTV